MGFVVSNDKSYVGLFEKLIIIMLSYQGAHSQNICDDEALARFRVRAQCWYSSTEKNCKSLPFYTGTAAGAALALKSADSPEYAQLKKYLNNLKKTSGQLLSDYRDVLRTFYDLKKKSTNPNFSESVSELRFEDYKMFEAELKKAHPKNSFIQRFDEYGHGRANDIFQRTLSYANSGLAQKTPMDHFFNTMSPTLQLDLNRSFQVFREVSVEKGYPQNGDPKWDTPEARAKIQVSVEEQKAAMKEDLKALRSGSQSGKATVRVMGATAGVAAALTPIVDLNRKRAAIVNCGAHMGVKLSEAETIQLTHAIELKGLLQKTQSACDQFIFTAEQVSFLLEPQSLTPALKQYFCSLETRMATEQDASDNQVDWHREGCSSSLRRSDKPIQIEFLQNNVTEIKTSQGTQVSIQTNSIGEWDYSSLKSINDADFNQYLRDKIKHPLNYKSNNAQNINPRVLCDGRDSGRYPKTLCEISRALRVASQTRSLTKAICDKRHGEIQVRKTPSRENTK